MKVWIIGGLLFVAGMAACAGEVNITAETASGTQGAGGAGSSGSGVNSSAGTGGPGPGLSKVVTADTDIGQYVSITTNSADPSNTVETKVIDGPFFLTDALFPLTTGLSIVQGGDCTVPESKHAPAVRAEPGLTQIHGIRIPVLAGQSLCAFASAGNQATVYGFKPY